MLKIFRNKNVTKIVLWAILVLTLPAFVVVGYMSTDRSDKKGPKFVGTIENKKISFDDFAGSISCVRCQIILNYYNNAKALESFLKNKSFVGRLAWDRLLLLHMAGMAKIKAPDSEVIKFITTQPIFLRNGKFDDRIYEYFLRNSLGIYPRNFEEMIRENIMIQKLTDNITKDVKISDEEVVRDYQRDNSKFKISYILVPLGSFAKDIKIPEEDIKKFYEANKNSFVIQSLDAENKNAVKKIATYDEVKDAIKGILAEEKARPAALESANKTYDELRRLMDKDKLSFEAAAAKLKLKTQESVPFIKSDYLEGVGEAAWIAAEAIKMKKDEISKPANIKKGVLIFRVAEVLPFDQETFKKEKEDFTKKSLSEKKNVYLEGWLAEREKGAKLNIDLNDYEKYYGR
ncbi:MAG: SurA N-terminal domain-containing protein [Candidatus Omnitrophica bacterium]|nr:SurA N-terminal domain-containing protein [Candidatus Omnitrophota bacterium]MDD5436215.1 SurA N-terminal domain-containing protein [Candidatus Omnitrophota bacterium]